MGSPAGWRGASRAGSRQRFPTAVREPAAWGGAADTPDPPSTLPPPPPARSPCRPPSQPPPGSPRLPSGPPAPSPHGPRPAPLPTALQSQRSELSPLHPAPGGPGPGARLGYLHRDGRHAAPAPPRSLQRSPRARARPGTSSRGGAGQEAAGRAEGGEPGSFQSGGRAPGRARPPSPLGLRRVSGAPDRAPGSQGRAVPGEGRAPGKVRAPRRGLSPGSRGGGRGPGGGLTADVGPGVAASLPLGTRSPDRLPGDSVPALAPKSGGGGRT